MGGVASPMRSQLGRGVGGLRDERLGGVDTGTFRERVVDANRFGMSKSALVGLLDQG